MATEDTKKVEYEEVTVDDTPLSEEEKKETRKKQYIIAGILAAIVLIVGGTVYYFYQYLPEQEAKAEREMFRAIQYYKMDSLDLALNGTGQYPGFLRIIKKYDGTKRANLAKLYTGSIYLKKNQPELAIKYLKDFSTGENLISAAAYSALGNAYLQLKKYEEAAEYFEKAAETEENSYTSPMFLLDAATAYELAGKKQKALEVYRKIKQKFPNSEEGQQIDKYIYRLKAQ